MKHKHIYTALTAAIALAFSITSWYGISYLLLILFFTITVCKVSIFDSYVSRFILGLLSLFSIIMAYGVVANALQSGVYPTVVCIIFTVLVVVFRSKNQSEFRVINRADVVSILTALVFPMIIYFSYFFPHASNVGLYQFLSNGWDNLHHSQMIYANGTPDSPSSQSGYPQAWHLANANVIDGFGNPLRSIHLLPYMWVYLAIIMGWFITLCYLCTKLSIVVARRFASSKEHSVFNTHTSAVISSIVLQSICLLGAVEWGYANYIGLMVYMTLVAAVIVTDTNSQSINQRIIYVSLFSAASIFCWFLPLVSICITLVLFILSLASKNKLGEFISAHILSLIIAAALIAISFLQIVVFMRSWGQSGIAQLNETGTTYMTSELLLTILLISTIIFTAKYYGYIKKILVIVAPLLITTVGIYAVQYLTGTKPSYYYFKMVGLLAIYVLIFCTPVIVKSLEYVQSTLQFSRILSSMTVVTLVALVVFGSGSTFVQLKYLLQGNSIVSYNDVSEVVSFIESNKFNGNNLVVIRSNPELVLNAALFTHITNGLDDCVYSAAIKNYPVSAEKLNNSLASCVDMATGTTYVLTDSKTIHQIEALHNNNIQIIDQLQTL